MLLARQSQSRGRRTRRRLTPSPLCVGLTDATVIEPATLASTLCRKRLDPLDGEQDLDLPHFAGVGMVPGSEDPAAVHNRAGLDLEELLRQHLPALGCFAAQARVHIVRVRPHRFLFAPLSRHNYPCAYISGLLMGRDYKRGAYMMTQISELNLLIDKASAIAGSDAKLAVLIGSHAQTVSNWRHGKSCPPEMQALMAHVAGLDPVAELARATVRKFEGDKKGDLLMRALGKASRLTGAMAGFVGAVALAISSLIPQRAEAAPAHRLCGDNVH